MHRSTVFDRVSWVSPFFDMCDFVTSLTTPSDALLQLRHIFEQLQTVAVVVVAAAAAAAGVVVVVIIIIVIIIVVVVVVVAVVVVVVVVVQPGAPNLLQL